MKLETYRCDLCKGSQFGEGRSFLMVVGREMCPSGNGYLDDCKNMDVCEACLRKALITYPPAMEFLELK